MRIGAVSLAMAIALVVLPARAADPEEDQPSATGLRFGLRTGYALPLGRLGEETNLFDVIRGHLPIWIDAGVRATPWLYVGAFGSLGIGFLGDSCTGSASCSATLLRVGVNAHVHLRPRKTFDPWVGLGVGYESLAVGISSSGSEQTAKASGLEPIDFQLGVDLLASPRLRLGPFVTFTIAQYTSASTNGIDDTDFAKRFHHWVVLGLRGAYDVDF